MDDLEALRRKRLRELQAQQSRSSAPQDQDLAAAQAAEEEAARQEAAVEAFLQQILAPEARERLVRIRMSRPELADSVTQQLIRLAQSGRLPGRLTDDDLRRILAQVMPRDRDIKITRK